jgi:hypothetical protein
VPAFKTEILSSNPSPFKTNEQINKKANANYKDFI